MIFAHGVIKEVAHRLMGEPNAQLSTGGNTRYGTNGSLSIKVDDNTFYDHEQKSGGGVLDLICRETGLSSLSDAAKWMQRNDLAPPEQQKVKPRIVATYDYRDEDNNLLFQVVRYDPKAFIQRRPREENGGWEYKVKGTRQVPYRLPELLKSPPDSLVYVVEGEKDVDRLASLGIIATCNAGGAGKWRDVHAKHLAGRTVVVIPDNDEAGRKHAQEVAKTLKGIAESVRVLALPGLPEKGDVSDWLEAGGTAEALRDMASKPEEEVAQPVFNNPDDEDDETPYGSELQLSEEFANRVNGFIRWTPGLEWMVNNGTHWEKDDRLNRFNEAKAICRGAASKMDSPKIAAKICSAGTHNAILNLARSSQGIVTSVMDWDKHPMLLNTPGDVVDLETGKQVSRDGLLFTQVSGVHPSSMATPIWDRFISEVFDYDLEMVEFMQRMGGYSLTGSIKEQKLFFLHGNGANGKSVFLDVLRAIGGKYSYNLPSEALMTSKHESHPTMLASLHGKRLAISSEIEESAHWAEARIKSMTGDETLTARYMRQDFFEFRVSHKHVIAGNFKPRLKGDDFAMARRMVLIPFAQRFEGSRRDNNLPEKLKAEYPGILAWFIEGARKWSESGLAIPGAITEASREYMAEQDDIGLWVASCCEQVKGARELATNLFASFEAWKRTNGEHAGSAKTFSQRLERTYDKKRVTRGMEFIGLRLINDFRDASIANAYAAASRGD